MGTTTSANLDLIKPDNNEPMANWPAQHDTNIEILDDFIQTRLVEYTPTFTGTGSNPSVGAGFIEGYYLRIWPNLVYFMIRVEFGAGLNVGSGTYEFGLPINSSSIPVSGSQGEGAVVGAGYYRDDSAVGTSGHGSVALSSTTRCRLSTQAVYNSRQIGSGTPVAWASGDKFAMYGLYVASSI